MAIETLYADALTNGTVSTSTNALGTTNGVYTTDTGNVSWTARFSLANPVNPATAGATHTVTMRVRKETGQSGTPSAQVNLQSGSTLIKSIIATTSVTNATSQDLAGTFTTTELSDLTAVQVEVVATATGRNPSTRSSVQLDSIELDANTTPAAPAVKTAYRISFPTPARALVDGACRILGQGSTQMVRAPTGALYLYEAGSQIGCAIWSGTVTGTEASPMTVEGTWDSTGRTAASIEARFVGTGVSGGTAKLHSIEWIATEASVALEESTRATYYAIRTIDEASRATSYATRTHRRVGKGYLLRYKGR